MKYDFVKKPLHGLIPIDEADLNELERKYNFRFPQALRDYYLLLNGCDIQACRMKREDQTVLVTEIIPVNKGSLDLEDQIQLAEEDQYLSAGLIPFATNPVCGIFYFHKDTQIICHAFYDDLNEFQYICTGMDTFLEAMNRSCEERDDDTLFDITTIDKER